MKHGVVIGKFDPFHIGHVYCITSAEVECDYVTVMIVNSVTNRYPLQQRIKWITETFALNPKVRVIVVDDIYDDDNSQAWAEAMIAAGQDYFDRCEIPFTHMFGSEHYVVDCAKQMGIAPVIVDLNRTMFPISATAVAENPIAHRDDLPSSTRAYFTRPVIVCGPESSGTTTLANMLAEHYETEAVLEYGRCYCGDLPADYEWSHRDFMHIAATQTSWIRQVAMHSYKPFVISDTDALTTFCFEKMYLGETSRETYLLIEAAHKSFYRPPLYIVTAPTIPFIQDGLRTEDPAKQAQLYRDLKDYIHYTSLHHHVLILETPDPQERLNQALAFLEQFKL